MAEDDQFILMAGIPHRIDARENPELARLDGFPENIAFFGSDRTPDGKTRMASAVYQFDQETYREDENTREMLYFPERRESGFRVLITFQKTGGIWSVEKYRGDEWVGGGGGPAFEGAMLHASMAGLARGEAEAGPSGAPGAAKGGRPQG